MSLRRVLYLVGCVYLGAAVLFIFVSYGAVIYFKGFWALAEIVNPFNFINIITVFLTLAPGLLLVRFAGAHQGR